MGPAILFMANEQDVLFILSKNKRFPNFHLHLQAWVVRWQTCGLSKGEGFHGVMKTMAHFGSRNDKTIIKLTIVDLDNSDVFDFCVS